MEALYFVKYTRVWPYSCCLLYTSNTLRITFINVDIRGRHADENAAVFYEHHVVFVGDNSNARDAAGLCGDVVVLKTLTASLLRAALAGFIKAHVFRELRTLAIAKLGDGKKLPAGLCDAGAHEDVYKRQSLRWRWL